MIIKSQMLVRIFSVVLYLAISPLGAATLDSTYVGESNPIIKNNYDHPLEYSNNDLKVSFKIGTLTITSVGSGDPPPLKELKLERSGNDDEESELVATEEIDGEDEFDAMLIARITYCGSRTKIVLIDDEDSKKMLKNKDLKDCPNPYPITIEFFMVIKDINNASEADGVGFQFVSGEGPGNFQLEAKDTSNNRTDVPIDGSTTASPFAPPEFTDGSGSSFINIEEIDTTWDASLLIDQSATGTLFDLVSELGSPGGATVGIANLTLGGYSGHPEYGVYITFEDAYKGLGDNSFRLKHEGFASYIPFTLFLGGDEITNGLPHNWSNLSFPPVINQKNLVVKVNYYEAISKISGTYSDIISVTISPHETNPFTL